MPSAGTSYRSLHQLSSVLACGVDRRQTAGVGHQRAVGPGGDGEPVPVGVHAAALKLTARHTQVIIVTHSRGGACRGNKQ